MLTIRIKNGAFLPCDNEVLPEVILYYLLLTKQMFYYDTRMMCKCFIRIVIDVSEPQTKKYC